MSILITSIAISIFLIILYFGLSAMNKYMIADVSPEDCPICGTKKGLKALHSGGFIRHHVKRCDKCGYIREIIS